jgi:hypothetical protein
MPGLPGDRTAARVSPPQCSRRETLVFAGNGFRCPLTQVAERLGAERGSVTDIYLPRWFARNLPAIYVPLIGLAGFHQART